MKLPRPTGRWFRVLMAALAVLPFANVCIEIWQRRWPAALADAVTCLTCVYIVFRDRANERARS